MDESEAPVSGSYSVEGAHQLRLHRLRAPRCASLGEFTITQRAVLCLNAELSTLAEFFPNIVAELVHLAKRAGMNFVGTFS